MGRLKKMKKKGLRKFIKQKFQSFLPAMQMEECIDATDDFPEDEFNPELWHSLRHFKHIFVCLTIGSIALCSSLFALIARSCLYSKENERKSFWVPTFLMTLSAMPITVAVVIAQQELHGHATFVELGIDHYQAKLVKQLPFTPETTTPLPSITT